MSYDEKCLELAEDFLEDEPWMLKNPGLYQDASKVLAQHIQDAIESWIQYERETVWEKPLPGDHP